MQTTAVIFIVVGLLLGMVVFGEPWHLQPNWGDAPTWVLVGLGTAGGWATFRQLQLLQQQLKEDEERNAQRDQILQMQLGDVLARERAERRRQAEDIELRFYQDDGQSFGLVENNSRRPIADLICRVVDRETGELLRPADSCGEVTIREQSDGRYPEMGPRVVWSGTRPGSRHAILRPGRKCRFTFGFLLDRRDPPHTHPKLFTVVWFTDDAGFRWQLDQFMHLAETEGDEYKPLGPCGCASTRLGRSE